MLAAAGLRELDAIGVPDMATMVISLYIIDLSR
jgi:hypothetical protein